MYKYKIIYSQNIDRFQEEIQRFIDEVGYENIQRFKISHQEYEFREQNYDSTYADVIDCHYADIIYDDRPN